MGGWTDTWFGGPGRLLHLAARPGVQVRIEPTGEPGPVVLEVSAFSDRYTVEPGQARQPRHPLLEAAIDALVPPGGQGLEMQVTSSVPPGCGTGTSAAVTVAALSALAAWRQATTTPLQVAYAAHALEVDTLGMESGIQDHLCAALGGANFLTIDDYPVATVEVLPAWPELDARLTHVFLGRAHKSDEVHRSVIEDTSAQTATALARLRDAALAGRDAFLARDLAGFGAAMAANTDAQRALHPSLVGVDAQRELEVAAQTGAIGWKVNGAGGDGGSVTLLSPGPAEKAALEAAVSDLDDRYTMLHLESSADGLAVHRAAEV